MGRRRWLAKALVVGQIVLATALLTGSVILIDAIEWLQYSSPGFEPDGLVTLAVGLPATRHETPAEVAAFYRQARENVAAVAGVESASFVSSLPRSPFNPTRTYSIEGEPESPEAAPHKAIWLSAGPGYFATLGVPVLEGRDFTSADRAETVPVAIVNRAFARRHFERGATLGERIVIDGTSRTIVGVVDNIWQELLAGEGDGRGPAVYVPHGQAPLRGMALAARIAPGSEETVVPSLRAAIWDVDPRLSLGAVLTFEEYVGQFFGTRGLGLMMQLFGGLSLLLAAVGIYGVIAFSVGRRTQEIGLRMAMGARRPQVLRMVAMEGVKLLAIGLALGVPVVFLVARAVRVSLRGLGPTDPLAALPMIVVLAVVALVAAYIPARRASRLEPTIALGDH